MAIWNGQINVADLKSYLWEAKLLTTNPVYFRLTKLLEKDEGGAKSQFLVELEEDNNFHAILFSSK